MNSVKGRFLIGTMFKDILQLIGVVALVLVVLFAVFFLLDDVHLLNGMLEDYVSVMHANFKSSWSATKAFLSGSGLADEAATILGNGADKLKDVADSIATDSSDTQEDSGTDSVTEEPADTTVYGSDPTVTDTQSQIVFSTPSPEA